MIKTDEVNSIKNYLEQHHAEMIEFLERLVSIETPSRVPFAQIEIFNILKKELEQINYHCIQSKSKLTGGYLYARPKKRNKKLPLQLLVGHCDTVWPEFTLKDMPIIRQNGQLKGPGVYDMKVGLTQLIFALKSIKELQLDLEVTPILLINSDEEIGSFESTHIISMLSKISERAFVLEPPLGLDGKLKTARKGVGRFQIIIKGKAAHAGLDPSKGINAIVELSHQIQQLYEMNDPKRGISVNIGMIEGGISANVVAPESKAVVDVRVLTEEDGRELTNKILGLRPQNKNVSLIVEGSIRRPPMEQTARNKKLWKVAKDKGEQLGLQLHQATAGGGSDGNTTSKYTATLDGLGTPGDGAHAEHEFIFINKIIERTALLILLLTNKTLTTKL